MTEPITFGQLHGVLEQLGFRKSAGNKDHVAYRHEATGTVLYFPAHRAIDLVPASSIVGTRKVLVDRGVVEAERLEQLFHSIAA
jgi:predicted RNA binding protein YcfA (HicA-like mRNA interferase family)